MANSHIENKEWVSSVISQLPVTSALDCGAGWGIYGKMLRQLKPDIEKLDAIEVWQPNIEKYNLNDIYDNVFNNDIRTHSDYNYDLVIFGDVLEHMTRLEAITLWEWVRNHARYIVLSLPIIPFPQHDVEDNPYEVHVTEDWTHEQVMLSFSGIVHYKTFSVVGAYFAYGGELEYTIYKLIKDQAFHEFAKKQIPAPKPKRTRGKK
jgi:hypothetical protein